MAGCVCAQIAVKTFGRRAPTSCLHCGRARCVIVCKRWTTQVRGRLALLLLDFLQRRFQNHLQVCLAEMQVSSYSCQPMRFLPPPALRCVAPMCFLFSFVPLAYLGMTHRFRRNRRWARGIELICVNISENLDVNISVNLSITSFC